MRMTVEDVAAQKERFETFMKAANLTKIGKKYFHFMLYNAQDGRYNQYCYIHRVLRMVARVQGAMYDPGTNQFYADILTFKSISIFLNSLTKLPHGNP